MRVSESPPSDPLPSLFPWPAAVIGLTVFAALVPMLLLGIPSGHDFEFHLDSWIEVLGQWRQGIVYPRWAELAHYGYGEARFLFYPPASWTLGALLGSVLPWKLVPGVFNWIALTAAGFSMFFLGRRWLSCADAVFAAALYAANPYNLVIVYWRSAYAELLAGIVLPLLLLFVLRAVEDGARVIAPLALIVAAGWLADAPAAVMVNYSLALLVVVVAIASKSPRIVLYGAVAVIVGAALAGFYLLPAAYEQPWVNISQVLSPGVRPQDNFLFTTINDPDHNRFNLLISIVACVQILMVAAAALLSIKRRPGRLWWALAAWAAVAAVLMASFTFVFWEHLPELRFVQLPWRWLLCLNVPVAMLLVMVWRRWVARAALYLAMLLVVVIVWHKVQTPWWDHAADVAEIRDNIRQGAGYEGTDEYVPTGGDAYEIKQHAAQVRVEGGGNIRMHVQQWSPESKIIEADVSRPAKLVLRLFNYPAWKVTINSRPAEAETADVTGQMVISVEPGDNRVRIVFSRTWDRTLGGVISVVTLLGIGVTEYLRRRRSSKMLEA